MKKITFLLLGLALVFGAQAQEKNAWSLYTGSLSIPKDKGVSRASFPKSFQLFAFDQATLRSQLFQVVDNVRRHSIVIQLPNADGQMESFEVTEASNFEPALQAQFPEIRAFSGKGLTDKFATLKLSYSPQGIQTTVFRTDRENEFMEPYSADHRIYAVFRSQRDRALNWNCSTPEEKFTAELNMQVITPNMTARSGADLKTMRLAQSCNAEYANYFGATSSAQVNLVLAAYNNTLTRCNGIYEKDFALHLNLIANTASVIYYTASSDPYTTLSSWNSQLQSTLNSVIGAANYDIGHMFGSTGGGGNAGCIGCVCSDANKGSGITSPADGIPQGDNFDIDYVAHEVGHQLGANHTFSHTTEGTGVNKEPGSGITIMGYAGITAQDMTNHSIDIFHQASIAQVQANLATKACPITTSIAANNATPVVAALTNYTIPRSTPFALTGSATDANGDALTYCWEQNDNTTTTGTNSVASATKTTGPNWITFPATSTSTRLFPRLSTILTGGTVTGPLTGGDAGANCEALSSVARTLNFRLTVRDNAPYSSTAPVKVGQTQFADMVVTVNGTAGPFAVTAPNVAATFAGGSTQNITWSVNSTNLTPINCANVKITMSTDGGQTFPIVLSASTPNDGTEALVIPNTPTTTGRIKIEAIGNIFFDINNANFTVTGTVGCGAPTGLTSSNIGNNTATVSWTAVSGANNYSVEYKLNSSASWTILDSALVATTVNLSGLTQGSLYDWRVRATCTSGVGSYTNAQFTTTAPFVCNAPASSTITNITTSGATINWTAVNGAVSYAVDYKLSTDTTWTSATASTAALSVALSGLTQTTAYSYRISTNCGTNGNSGFTSGTFTTTAPVVCNAPTGLTATNITASGATLNWTAVSGATNYRVEFKTNAAATWTLFSSANATTSATLSGLTAATLYDYRVSTNCTGGSSSATAAQFTTLTAPACVTAFEPNETTAAAAIITNGSTNSAAISTSTDVDFFKITTTATSNIVYRLVGPAGVDFDLQILNSAGTQIGSAATTSSTETVTLNNQVAGTYFIRVFGFSGANSTTCYTIQATATPVATSCASSKDTSTNNATTGAATIAFNTDIRGLINVGSDVDHYRFVISRAGTITLTLTTLPANYHLRLVSSTGTILATSNRSGTSNETIAYTAAVGTYFARVYPNNTNTFNASSCYTLRVALGTAARPADYVTIDKAKPTMQIAPNPVHDRVNVQLSGFEGNAEISIFNMNGVQLMKRKATIGNTPFDFSRLTSGVYYIQVSQGKAILSRSKFIKQ
jgi:hypothetical protein